MKKILVLSMMVVMVMAVFAGCGQQDQAQGAADSQQQAQTQQQSQPQDQSANQTAQEQQGIVYEDGVAMNPADYDLISEDEAKQIALNKAEGAVSDNIRTFDLDYDDGRWVYEGEIHLDEWEYEFEINAESGDVISWEKDHIYD